MKNYILIIENDKDILKIWLEQLEKKKNFIIHSVENIKNAIKITELSFFDFIIINEQPSKENYDLLLKKRKETTLIFLLNSKLKKIRNENKNIFFYIKPIKLFELLEKMDLLIEIRVKKKHEKIKLNIHFLFPLERKIKNKKGEVLIDLTEKETLVLKEILLNKVVTKEKLLQNVWGFSSKINTSTLETHIYRLRKKILKIYKDKELIVNSKEGYRFSK